jgi:hypothetical protein
VKEPLHEGSRAAGEAIMDYLSRHPEAQDTIEGIISWWLPNRSAESSVAEVRAALEELVASGRVLAWRMADSRVLYRMNREGQNKPLPDAAQETSGPNKRRG